MTRFKKTEALKMFTAMPLCVCDSSNHCVSVFTPNCDVVWRRGEGAGPDEVSQRAGGGSGEWARVRV